MASLRLSRLLSWGLSKSEAVPLVGSQGNAEATLHETRAVAGQGSPAKGTPTPYLGKFLDSASHPESTRVAGSMTVLRSGWPAFFGSFSDEQRCAP